MHDLFDRLKGDPAGALELARLIVVAQSAAFVLCWLVAWAMLPAIVSAMGRGLSTLGRYACVHRHGWPPTREGTGDAGRNSR
jgi:hypothetical protein